MNDNSKILEILLDNKHISELEIIQDTNYKNKIYSKLISCKIDILSRWIPIIIGIPEKWDIELIDIYLLEKNYFIPHMDKDGKLCLFDFEGVIIYPELEGVLNACISKAREVTRLGFLEQNKEDFLYEFDSYFAMLNGRGSADVVMPTNKQSTIIKYCELLSRNKHKGRKSHINKEKVSYFASNNCQDFNTWKYNSTQKNGIYLYIQPSEPIYPPNIFENDLSGFLNKLLKFVDYKIFKQLYKRQNNSVFLIFEIHQNDKIVNSCGFVLDKPIFNIEEKVELISCSKIKPIEISRIDVKYLSSRTDFSSNSFSNKSILLIGCGSIGGYVFHNLIKTGCRKITLVDDDIMKPENIFRHFLGVESTYSYKTVALENYAKNTSPEMQINVVNKRIEKAVNFDLNLNDFDYIISATGSHMINQWINKYMLDNRILKTVFYVWNEPLDIGCHITRINISDEGDYRNIISVDQNGVSDLSSYVEINQNFVKSYSGCSGRFIPYGSTLSMESSILLINLLKREEEGRIKNNIIISKKGEDIYLKKSGFTVSNRYKLQKDCYLEVALKDLRKEIFSD